MFPVMAGSQWDRWEGGPAGRGLLLAAILFFVFVVPLNRGSSQKLREPTLKSGGVGVGIAVASTVLPTAIGTWLLWEDGGSTAVLGGLLLGYGWVVGPLPGMRTVAAEQRVSSCWGSEPGWPPPHGTSGPFPVPFVGTTSL